MKFGLCTSADKLTKLKPGTLDYIEMNLSAIHEMPEEKLREAAFILSGAGTPAETTNCFFPKELRLCGSEYRAQKVAEYTKRALEKASRLGIQLCVLGSGKSRSIGDGEDDAACMRQFEEVVRLAGELAQPYGITVALEPLRRAETNVINTVEEGGAVCRRIAHPNVRLLADLYHVADAGEPLDVLKQNADLLCHMHIANPATRSYPSEADPFDYGALKEALADAGYDRRISIEGSCPGDFAVCTEESIAFLRRVLG